MRRFTAMVVLLCTVCATGVVSQAAPMSEAEAVRTVLTANPLSADLFAASFLAQVPASQITVVRDQVIAQLGNFLRTEGGDGKYVGYFTRGSVNILIHLDQQGKIDGLRFAGVTGVSLQDALKPFESLPGIVSYDVIKNGQEIAKTQNNFGNAGMSPTVSLNGGINASNLNSHQEFNTGAVQDRTGAKANNITI